MLAGVPTPGPQSSQLSVLSTLLQIKELMFTHHNLSSRSESESKIRSLARLVQEGDSVRNKELATNIPDRDLQYFIWRA